MNFTNEVLMIRPALFYANIETMVDNSYQNIDNLDKEIINTNAIKEFDDFVYTLRNNGIIVNIIQDTESPSTPDSIFPNNWFSTHKNNLVIYSMFAENRKMEIIKNRDKLLEIFKYDEINIIDYSNDERILEGTGALVLDRDNKVAYCSLSSRADKNLLIELCDIINYKPLWFNSFHKEDAIYHTNVMMSVGHNYIIICLESIKDEKQRLKVKKSVIESGKTLIEISLNQVSNFLGNVIELYNGNEYLAVMSKTAYRALKVEQKQLIESDSRILTVDVSTIEYYGGGSARCMVAEIYR